LVTAIALFTLATVQTAINLILGAADIDGIEVPYDNLSLADMMIYVVNKSVPSHLSAIRILTMFYFRQRDRGRIGRARTCSNYGPGILIKFQIYRCYSVWNRNIYVIILPVILLITTSGRSFFNYCTVSGRTDTEVASTRMGHSASSQPVFCAIVDHEYSCHYPHR
jgi:hypothetical protein